MKKRSIILLIIGLIFIILPFLFNIYNIIRLFSIMIGILIITLSVFINKSNHIVLVLVVPLITFAITYGLDLLCFYAFNRIPIYVYRIDSNGIVKNYNSFFYRIYSCKEKLIMDYGYHMNYACSNNDLEIVDINELLANPQDSYTKYKNKFIKVHGKVSKIVNLGSIELNMWNKDDISINGHVNFNFNYILKIPIKEELPELRIYEEIDVIGRISKLINNGTTLYLVDAKIVSSDIYDSWSYEIIQNNNKTFKKITNNYYFYGINELNIKYTDELIYELSYLINDKKLDINDLVGNNVINKEYKDEENNIVAQEFILDKFNILRCSNERVIIANKNLKLNEYICLMDE